MAEFYDYFLNTIIICVGTVIISVGIGALAGYGLARYTGFAGVFIILVALGLRSLPRLGFLLPYYQMGQMSGLYDSFFLVILAMVAIEQPFTIVMMRSFFINIPSELEEAAMIDGASRLTAFIRIIVPIMWPGIFAVSLFTLLVTYHEFLLVRILTQSNQTLTVAMSAYIGGVSVPGSVPRQSAAAILSAIPLVIVVLIFQKQFVKGLAAGAVKG
jgi:multiple sugar transport system permease protein